VSGKSIFSSSWYRVRGLRPRLRSNAKIHRHLYRGETWYVLQELTMERFFRFTPSVYSVIGMMDGRRTVEELWHEACTHLGDDAPTQDEMIQLLGQLYQVDVLQCDVPADAAELLKRYETSTRRKWKQNIFSVFSWRFPLIDPERFLQFFLPVVRPLFSWFGALLWLAALVPALILFGTHWTDLTRGMLDRVFVANNIVLLWLLFPCIKACHEFGHAFATRVFGGEVHEMGVMLLVVTPVPYVDASSASAFQQKWRRVLVGAAGMVVELFIASVALFFWINAEAGVLRTLAYNTIFIAGLSTVFFNANPLLRYDGYYILSDLIEIPNLRNRSNSYLLYLCERYLFGNSNAEAPEATRSERAWFVSFGILSFVYRIFVVSAILLFIGQKFFGLGLLLAAGAAIVWFVTPVVKGTSYLFTNPRLRSVRGRALLVTLLLIAGVFAFLGFVPMPYRTGTEGVIWIPEESFVRSGAEGFVQEILAKPGDRVEKGTPLFRLNNSILGTQEQISAAHVRELQATYLHYLPTNVVKAESVRDELQEAQSRLAKIRGEIEDLTVRSEASGTFTVPSPEDLPQRFVRKGELLAYVLDNQRTTVRAAVSQPIIDLVQSQTEAISVRLSENLSETVPAKIIRAVPGASDQLPSKALGTAGGGKIAMDPTDARGLKAAQKVFQLDLEIPSHSKLVNLGGRCYIRFDHGWTPLAVQFYFQLRQLFLSRFDF
jgi:putative peptide zinc metalloprotease protein